MSAIADYVAERSPTSAAPQATSEASWAPATLIAFRFCFLYFGLYVLTTQMLAGMVPPIALALATVLRSNLFTVAERENGKAGWLMGASFITEGAIPFAAADPVRVIPSIMLGSAVTGALSEAFSVSIRAPHGGIFVLFAVHNIFGYLIALAAGVVVGAIAVIAAKTLWPADTDVATV